MFLDEPLDPRPCLDDLFDYFIAPFVARRCEGKDANTGFHELGDQFALVTKITVFRDQNPSRIF